MSLYYHEPFFSLNDFQRLFDDFWGERTVPVERRLQRGGEGAQSQVSRAWQPRLDIIEAPDQNLVTATFELPGLRKEDVNIDIRNNRLVVSGEVRSSQEINESGYVLRERQYGRFSRTLPLPEGTKPEEIKAKMDNGVLSVTFPKVSTEQEPKRITIN